MTYVRPEIEVMSGYEPGEQPQAGKFIKLNTNENPYPPSPRAVQAIEQAARQSLSRYPDPRATAFRLAAADVLNIEPDWILCGNGSDDVLTIVTRTFVSAGSTIRLPYPSYVLYRTLAQIQGARFQEVLFRPDWTLDPRFGAEEPGLRLVFLPNPNSPSGTVVPAEAILDLADRLPCPLLVDEAYADFADGDCLKLVAETDKILVSRTLSKSYALAGLRFGFVVAQPHMIQQLVKVKDSYNCDALAIAGATAAISDRSWLTDNRARILASRERLIGGLLQLGLSVVPSQANFVWCTHATRSLKSVYQKLKAARVLVRYMYYPQWGDGLRISVGTDPEIDACLSLLKAILDDDTTSPN